MKSGTGVRPTEETYGALQMAYDHFNAALFQDSLPPCLITLQRKGARVLGYFSPNRFGHSKSDGDSEIRTHEIAMNPLYFLRKPARDVISTLVHEMAHLWQQEHGKPSRRGYHNREWGSRMKELGLYPSNTGEPGGRETGQQMTHYIVEGGPFDIAFDSLAADSRFSLAWGEIPVLATGTPKPKTRLRYTCPECEAHAWGKPGLELVCGTCQKQMEAEG